MFRFIKIVNSDNMVRVKIISRIRWMFLNNWIPILYTNIMRWYIFISSSDVCSFQWTNFRSYACENFGSCLYLWSSYFFDKCFHVVFYRLYTVKNMRISLFVCCLNYLNWIVLDIWIVFLIYSIEDSFVLFHFRILWVKLPKNMAFQR